MKDATHFANEAPTRSKARRERTKYMPDAENCLALPLGKCTKRVNENGIKKVLTIDIQSASNDELMSCLKMLGMAMAKAGDPVEMVIQHPKVKELISEFVTERNGRITLQNIDFMESDNGMSNSCFYMPGKSRELMLTAEEAQTRREARLVQLKKSLGHAPRQ